MALPAGSPASVAVPANSAAPRATLALAAGSAGVSTTGGRVIATKLVSAPTLP
ncbi:hypothetical protein D3C80_2095220 [compost metagenome]